MKNFEDTARTIIMEDFKNRLNVLRERYDHVKEQIDDFYKKLDLLDEERVNEIIERMPVHLAQLEIIKIKIKEISNIIKDMKEDVDE
jgi:archaellum component FlaC